MRDRIVQLGLALGAAAGLATAPAAAQQPGFGESVKVGVVAFYTGASAGPFGIPSRNAAELLIEAINAGTMPAPYNTKGAGGLPIEPVYIDESGGTTAVVTEYRNMVQRQGVEAVVGYISSGSCLAVAPVADELKTFTIFYDCGTPRIFEDASYQYLFRTSAHATIDSVGAARYLVKLRPDLKSFEGINQNYAWGQDSWRDFELAMKALAPKAQNKGSQFPKLFAGQYGSEISALSVSRPEAIHSSLWGGDLESFILQAAPRGLDKQSKLVMTTAESAMFRLGAKMPDGLIMGGRGPYGVLARESELNSWFQKNYADRYGTPPIYASYHMANGILGLKVAFDKAAQAAGGNAGKLTSADVAKAFVGAEFPAFGTTIRLALGKGHQAITETAYGISKYDKEAGRPTITDVVYFPAECVNPPEGVNSSQWLEGGMKGAKCD